MSWWMWLVLVVAALASAAWLGWSLWRSGMGVLREAGRAGEALGSVGDRAAQTAAANPPPDTSPTIFEDPVVLRARVQEVRRRRATRADERTARNRRISAQWLQGGSAAEGWRARREAEKAAAAVRPPGGGRARTRLP